MKPNDLDRVILYLLLAIGTFTVYRFVFKMMDKVADRAFNAVEYKYLTSDHKVIQPNDFEDKDKSV